VTTLLKKEPKYPVYNSATDGCVYDWILEQAWLLRKKQLSQPRPKSRMILAEPTNETRR